MGSGIRYLEFYLENILKTASNPTRLRFILSCHTSEDRNLIEASELSSIVDKVIITPAFPDTVMFYPSANHSLAVNNLASEGSAEIVVISDYDMAFLQKGWDDHIERSLYIDDIDLFGVSYPSHSFNLNVEFKYIPNFEKISLFKYQRTPNLSFLALRRSVFEAHFNGTFTNLHRHLEEGSLPFRLINTIELSKITGLPLGALQWLDTGWEIPHVARTGNLRLKALSYAGINDRAILGPTSGFQHVPILMQPEVFFDGEDGAPFLAHYKKGTMKTGREEMRDLFDVFISEVENTLM